MTGGRGVLYQRGDGAVCTLRLSDDEEVRVLKGFGSDSKHGVFKPRGLVMTLDRLIAHGSWERVISLKESILAAKSEAQAFQLISGLRTCFEVLES